MIWTDRSIVELEFGGVLESPKTARGRAARERIVAATAELIAEHGSGETSLDDVIGRAGASKSQLYHYFDDRAALLRAVVAHNSEAVLGELGPLDSWRAIRAWFDSMIDLQVERHARGGCSSPSSPRPMTRRVALLTPRSRAGKPTCATGSARCRRAAGSPAVPIPPSSRLPPWLRSRAGCS